ncbi:hypothetical protein [Microbacterium paludicola]|uniref:hypothetical protein n=1 Tax=Microbacterium paludicola TaxID=300019 RepID=UPI0031E4656D
MSDRDNDMVHLSFGPDYEDGELILRADLPSDALRGAGDVQMEDPATGERRWFEVWVVDR